MASLSLLTYLTFIQMVSCQFLSGPDGLQYYDGLPKMKGYEEIPKGFMPELNYTFMPSDFKYDLKEEVESFLQTTSKESIKMLRIVRVDVNISNKSLNFDELAGGFMIWPFQRFLYEMMDDGEFIGNFTFLFKIHDQMHYNDLKAQVYHMMGSVLKIGEENRFQDVQDAIVNYNLKKFLRIPIVYVSVNDGPLGEGNMEQNTILIPDSYMLCCFKQWNEVDFEKKSQAQNSVFRDVIESFELFPWEQRIEKAFFRGASSGYSKHLCPQDLTEGQRKGSLSNRFFSCEFEKEVFGQPDFWQRVYLTRMSQQNPDHIDVRLTETNVDHDVEQAKTLLVRYQIDQRIKESDNEFYQNFMMNLDSIPETDDWRKIFCGRKHIVTVDQMTVFQNKQLWNDIIPPLKEYILGDHHSDYFSYFIMRLSTYGLEWIIGHGENEPVMQVLNWFWDKIYEKKSSDIFGDYKALTCGNLKEQYYKEWTAKDATYKDHFKFKYLLNVDGNSAAWFRFPMIMLSGSVPLKVESRQEGDFQQWFYKDLIPWVHYVPIKKDMSDLLEQIEWLRAHDDEAKKIAQEAHKFARYHFQVRQLKDYLKNVFREYEQIYNKAK